MMRKTIGRTLLSTAAAVSVAFAVGAAPTAALAQQCEDDASGPSSTLTPRIAQTLQTVFEQMSAEQYSEALGALNQLIAQRSDSMKPFDRATTYELRGSVKASLEDFRGAQRDFGVALETNALPPARNNQLRYFIAQLSFQLEDYQGAINGLNRWIQQARQCGTTVDPNSYYLLAAAYTQISPPNYRAAVDPAERAKRGAEEPKKGYYDLLNLIYSELNDNAKRTPLLEEMINNWPGNKSYWTQLSGAYSVTGKDRDAFSVLEVAYRAGLLTTESELLTLIQYYSFFDNPYRGAVMLDREMNAGVIKRNQKNLVLLSQLWSQAREHKRSIPVLRAAAGQAANGELYYRLGQVLLADEQYANAERALVNGINRGGMKSRDTGDAWLLLGTARFAQAGPEDVAVWRRARQAFVRAQRYDSARSRARDWVSYIDAVISTYEAGKELERTQILERCRDDLQRIERDSRIRELQNREPTAEEREREERVLAECGPEAEAARAAEQAEREAAAAEAEAGPTVDGEGGSSANATEETAPEGGEAAAEDTEENTDSGAEN